MNATPIITLALSTALCLLTIHKTAGQEQQPIIGPKTIQSWGFKPREFEGATLHARIPFLNPHREWERMDIWVPNDPPSDKMPCMIFFYGGGYGSKRGDVGDLVPLLKQGWVLAMADYILGATAPVPLCAYDMANAIRFLRANAAKYRIDPERIGVQGLSAGGWIAQDLFYTTTDRTEGSVYSTEDEHGAWTRVRIHIPMIDPHPQIAPEFSYQVQGVVSDWGAGRLTTRNPVKLQPWIASPAVPPLATVYGPNDETYKRAGLPEPHTIVNSVTALQAIGVPARGAYDYPGNTHGARFNVEITNEDGSKTTYGEMVFQFLDQHVKHPTVATAPELRPWGGLIDKPILVTILTVHPTGVIHYTLDETEPSDKSPVYAQPVMVQPSQTVKAIVIRPGLKPSRVAMARFDSGPPPPKIAPLKDHYLATVGEPFTLQLTGENTTDATWGIAGILNGLSCNPKTGLITGTPRMAIATPITAVVYREVGRERYQSDARQTVIVVRQPSN